MGNQNIPKRSPECSKVVTRRYQMVIKRHQRGHQNVPKWSLEGTNVVTRRHQRVISMCQKVISGYQRVFSNKGIISMHEIGQKIPKDESEGYKRKGVERGTKGVSSGYQKGNQMVAYR